MYILLCLFLCLPALFPAHADGAPALVNVWPGLAPGEQTANPGRIAADTSGNVTRLTDVTAPQLLIFRPDGSGPHPAVLVCPGGGYQILSTDLEGSEVARWLNSQGFVAAVLHYRVPGKRDAAFQDGQRALSVLRMRAAEFGIDPTRVGVLGFSAGGHLSARLACDYDKRSYPLLDATDRMSCRPDFALLIYPAYLIDSATGNPASEVQPHIGMPPLFLTQTRDDGYLCAPAYAAALERARVQTRCDIYDSGGHGYGLRLPMTTPAHHWPEEAAGWLRERLPVMQKIHQEKG